uniref:DDE Tnp4 domain-containing protein n=1 Tax=Anopheles dirus TaxID=7168 RepID=A0A182N9Y5_9DIPT
MRESISALQRLCIALRFLATGDSYASLSIVFRVSVASISTIVPEVCDAIIDVLKDYIVLPSTNAQWKEVSAEFERKWNCPHAIGAIDGKHTVRSMEKLSQGLGAPTYVQYLCYLSKEFRVDQQQTCNKSAHI